MQDGNAEWVGTFAIGWAECSCITVLHGLSLVYCHDTASEMGKEAWSCGRCTPV